MRVWVDLTNSPHVLVMRPLIELLRADGHEVSVTARDFSQTLELCERFGIDAHRHRPPPRRAHQLEGDRPRLALAGADPLGAPPPARRAARPSTSPSATAPTTSAWPPRCCGSRARRCSTTSGRRSSTSINCRLARAVVVPEAIPPERLARYGATRKLRRYEGLKEEYYLSDFEPDEEVLRAAAASTAQRPLVVVRTPPELSLYHRFGNDLFAALLERLDAAAAGGELQCVVLPRAASQTAALAEMRGLLVPGHVIDAQSLCAFADAVVSAGGTMNREAVALGHARLHDLRGPHGGGRRTPDRRGPAAPAHEPRGARPGGARRRAPAPARVRRDPRVLLELALSAL